jgi:alkanesulfonate monooxygenase SsuD/methylene tetrahydromethanopterin reductase-like flavin-dependent oxidoreductase (luciferase family)
MRGGPRPEADASIVAAVGITPSHRVSAEAETAKLTPPSAEDTVMKVGLFINTQFPDGFSVADRIPEIIEQVRVARDAGFKSLWFPHHWLTYPLQMLQITPMMGYIAAHAQGMTIGPNILILPPQNPMHVAEEAATLDVLTGGNYILGIGQGYRQPEFDAFGIPLSERAPRFNESIGLMKRLWTEDRISHKGRFYTIDDAGIDVKPCRPAGRRCISPPRLRSR